jgi:hypothetical protein
MMPKITDTHHERGSNDVVPRRFQLVASSLYMARELLTVPRAFSQAPGALSR